MKSFLLLCAVSALLFVALEGSHAVSASSTYQVTLSYSLLPTSGSGNPPPPSLQYTYDGHVVKTALSTQPTTYNIDIDAAWNASSLLQGSNSTQRWVILGSDVGTGAAQARVLVYYRQEFVTFSYIYDGDGQIFPKNNVTYITFGVPTSEYPPVSVWADYNAPYSFGNKTNYVPPDARFYVAGQNGVIGGPGRINAGYFEQYSINFGVSFLGPDTFGTTTLEESFAGGAVNHTLSQAGGTFWVDYNSSFVVQPTIYVGSGSYRWFLSPLASSHAYAPESVALQYVEQFPVTVQVGVSGGAEPSPPELTATIDRQVTALQLLPGTSVTWVDAEFGYQVSNQLQGSAPNERWYTNGVTSGVASGPVTVNLEYFHQVLVPLSYSVVGGGAIPAFNAEYTSFGSVVSVPVGTTPSDQWVDYGSSLAVPGNLTGSSQFQRWALANPPQAFVIVPGAVSLVYYHQYYVPFVYVISGQGSPPAAALNGSEFGAQYTWTLISGTSTWLDGGSPWSVSTFLPSTISGERWEGSGALNGTVNQGTVIEVTYQHEYFVSVMSNPPGGGALSGGGWALAGGVLGFSTTPNSGYAFTGWHGSGQGSYSGERENYTGVLSAPVQEVAEYYVGIVVQVSGRGSVTVKAGTSTFSVGGRLTLYVPPGTTIVLAANPGPLESFAGWQGIPVGTAGAVSLQAETPLGVGASFTTNNIEVLGLVTLYFGVAAFVILYFVTKRQPTSIFRGLKSSV
jgi:hypothetical protein